MAWEKQPHKFVPECFTLTVYKLVYLSRKPKHGLLERHAEQGLACLDRCVGLEHKLASWHRWVTQSPTQAKDLNSPSAFTGRYRTVMVQHFIYSLGKHPIENSHLAYVLGFPAPGCHTVPQAMCTIYQSQGYVS